MAPSQRIKRLLNKLSEFRGARGLFPEDDSVDQFHDEEMPSKEELPWWSVGQTDKPSKLNFTVEQKPAELFRKDLISAMKLPDTEQLPLDSYYMLTDPWREEWEKGVQVPVHPEALSKSNVIEVEPLPFSKNFRLPKKLLRSSRDDFFQSHFHQLQTVERRAFGVCRYDLDDADVSWLDLVNADRVLAGLEPVSEEIMEMIIDELETHSHVSIQRALRQGEGLGIEFDEATKCDVCKSPDSEEGNEIVFCDGCDTCVHQACYGIQTIPEGDWLCRTCALGIRPSCLFCPVKGGAMKATKSATKWAHVSCALWIPEVRIVCPDTMEPIANISAIPASRWDLVCCVCREKMGACIQCNVKSCKVAFHVTCAYDYGLRMEQFFTDEPGEGGVNFKAYCPKHSGSPKKSDLSNRKDQSPVKGEETTKQRLARINQIQGEFYNYVRNRDIAASLGGDIDAVDLVCEYWKLKRKSEFNKPLLTPKQEQEEILVRQQEDNLYVKLKFLIYLRQDLERVRNLCYMIERREKHKRNWYKQRQAVFDKQNEMFNKFSRLSEYTIKEIVGASHDNTIYDHVLLCGRGKPEKYKSWKHNRPVEVTNSVVLSPTHATSNSTTHVVDTSSSDSRANISDSEITFKRSNLFEGASHRKLTIPKEVADAQRPVESTSVMEEPLKNNPKSPGSWELKKFLSDTSLPTKNRGKLPDVHSDVLLSDSSNKDDTNDVLVHKTKPLLTSTNRKKRSRKRICTRAMDEEHRSPCVKRRILSESAGTDNDVLTCKINVKVEPLCDELLSKDSPVSAANERHSQRFLVPSFLSHFDAHSNENTTNYKAEAYTNNCIQDNSADDKSLSQKRMLRSSFRKTCDKVEKDVGSTSGTSLSTCFDDFLRRSPRIRLENVETVAAAASFARKNNKRKAAVGVTSTNNCPIHKRRLFLYDQDFLVLDSDKRLPRDELTAKISNLDLPQARNSSSKRYGLRRAANNRSTNLSFDESSSSVFASEKNFPSSSKTSRLMSLRHMQDSNSAKSMKSSLKDVGEEEKTDFPIANLVSQFIGEHIKAEDVILTADSRQRNLMAPSQSSCVSVAQTKFPKNGPTSFQTISLRSNHSSENNGTGNQSRQCGNVIVQQTPSPSCAKKNGHKGKENLLKELKKLQMWSSDMTPNLEELCSTEYMPRRSHETNGLPVKFTSDVPCDHTGQSSEPWSHELHISLESLPLQTLLNIQKKIGINGHSK